MFSTDKPARLIIRLLFGLVSNSAKAASAFVKLDRNINKYCLVDSVYRYLSKNVTLTAALPPLGL